MIKDRLTPRCPLCGQPVPVSGLETTHGAIPPFALQVPTLTRRQVEVMDLIAAGKSNKDISSELGITVGTVKLNVTAIFKALSARNRVQASHLWLQISEEMRKKI